MKFKLGEKNSQSSTRWIQDKKMPPKVLNYATPCFFFLLKDTEGTKDPKCEAGFDFTFKFPLPDGRLEPTPVSGFGRNGANTCSVSAGEDPL